MKKILASITTMIMLLGPSGQALARPGDAIDPLVTRSYVDKQIYDLLNPATNQLAGLQQELDQLAIRANAIEQHLAELLLNYKDIAARPEKLEIIRVVKLGWLQGYADGSFRPAAALTRKDLALLMVKAKGVPLSQSKLVFKDVKATDPLARVVVTAAEKKLVPPRSKSYFRPDQALTRGEMAYYLARNFPELLPKAGTKLSAVKDSQKHWARTQVQKVVASGLMDLDKQGKFYPNRLLTRAEAAKIMAKVADRKKL